MSRANRPVLVHQTLEQSTQRYPDKTALIFRNHRLTFSDFDRRANTLAHGLVEQGVKRGDRVIVWYANSVETCIAIYAILKAGGAFVIINSTTKGEKLLKLVKDCTPAALITDEQHLRQVKELLWALAPELQVILIGEQPWPSPSVTLYSQILANSIETPPPVRCIDRDLAALIYTSGSTGMPKGVMSAHYNIIAAASAITQYLENTADDRIINVLPLAFDYGLYQLLMAVFIGGTLVLERSFAFPYEILDLMRCERVTGLPGVPTIFAMLLQLDPEQLRLPDLRYLTNTGAALPVNHIERLREIMGSKVRIYSMYGQTECKRTLYLPPTELGRRPGSVGIPIPNEEVFVVDDSGNEVSPGEIGELTVRGANVMLGYWGLPEESARVFRPGPLPGERILFSGDLFRRDEDGFLYFVARKDDVIKSRGQKVSPKEVEAALFRIEGITDAAVVGIVHPLWGQAIQAHVSLDPEIDLDEKAIIRHCRQLLEDFMVPDEVIFHNVLPKNSSGKTDYSVLIRDN
jgi:long-chain acyl-CoA synthetase